MKKSITLIMRGIRLQHLLIFFNQLNMRLNYDIIFCSLSFFLNALCNEIQLNEFSLNSVTAVLKIFHDLLTSEEDL